MPPRIPGRVERVHVTGDAKGVGGGETGFGKRVPQLQRSLAERCAGLSGEESEAIRVRFLLARDNRFDRDLGAFERQRAYLDHGERGQCLTLLAEHFGYDLLHASDIAGAGDEGAELYYRAGSIVVEQETNGLARLLRQKTLRRQRQRGENERAGLRRDRGRRFFGRRKSLGDFFRIFLLYDGQLGVRLILLVAAFGGRAEANDQYEQNGGPESVLHGVKNCSLANRMAGSIAADGWLRAVQYGMLQFRL